jgi:O-acetyl-ADP-ribose deacetylase (regulator of RNase III)
MLKFITGDIFNSDCHYLVNPVNCVGVMGSGLAKIFKEWAPPAYFEQYVVDCNSGELKIGQVTAYSFTRKARYNTIINFPTKIHWKDPSKSEWIRPGLDDLADLICNETNTRKERRTLAMPKLGCGLGGLCWADVKTIIKDWYCDLNFNLDVEVYV